jgi:hypothetical protein
MGKGKPRALAVRPAFESGHAVDVMEGSIQCRNGIDQVISVKAKRTGPVCGCPTAIARLKQHTPTIPIVGNAIAKHQCHATAKSDSSFESHLVPPSLTLRKVGCGHGKTDS